MNIEQMMTSDPKVLYRYRHLQGKHREWTRRILTDSILYFAKPSELDDPFDCRVQFRRSLSCQEVKRKSSDLLRRYMPQLSRAQRRAKAAKDLKSRDSHGLLPHMTKGLQAEAEKVGVLSLSVSNSDIQLWSLYAAGHTGLCLKFMATDDTPFFGCAQPVNYTSKRPVVDLSDPPEHQVQAFLLTKSTEWKYQEEWRIICPSGGPGNKVFPEELLIGVIFGAEMEAADMEDVIEWVKGRKNVVELYQASLSSDSYSLRIEQYRP
jgi:hypothetical protein